MAKFNLGRAKIRLEGLSHYASVSALLLNGALRIFTATPKKLDDRKDENFVKILFLISITATVVLGGYTATVFSLLGLYFSVITRRRIHEFEINQKYSFEQVCTPKLFWECPWTTSLSSSSKRRNRFDEVPLLRSW
jgi:hypothetical protein